ncbi:MAG: hypothetical protein LBQ98_05415 [Nitrososphaerota archaeon]|jgi:hypothetical protein|nr:hypothetical protein [Nitrososphaerota archaeon]
MNKQLLLLVFIIFFSFSVVYILPIVCGQTIAPTIVEPLPTEEPLSGGFDPLLIVGIIVAVVVIVVVVIFTLYKKRQVNEKSLRKVPSRVFEEWIIKKFNGRPGDPSLDLNGFTEGGQPLLIVQSDHVSLAEVQDFVKLLVKGRAQKGTIVAFNFDNDAIEGKVDAMDNEIDLQLLRVSELTNKRFANRLKNIASTKVAFDVSAVAAYIPEPQMHRTATFEKMLSAPVESQNSELKPRVFISNSDTKVAEQVKRMLDFLHYDYIVGGKEETAVPISENKFGLMTNCDCAIINIAAAEQERRYSGLYILNSTVTSEINAAYLKYNTQVVLLVERKVELPPNFKGLKKIEYDSDDLSFNAAMELEKILVDFKKML